MEMTRLFELDNDGLNMAVDGDFLYLLSKRAICRYSLSGAEGMAQKPLFKKNGKARTLAVSGSRVYVTDFCDLYILKKDDLEVVDVVRIGVDLSSDLLGIIAVTGGKVYCKARHGVIAAYSLEAKAIERYVISEESFWSHCAIGDRLYLGTVKGELLELNGNSLEAMRRANVCKKNIYDIAHSEGALYMTTQDRTIVAVRADTLEITRGAKKAVGGMALILGVYDNRLAVADSGKITFWDADTLAPRGAVDFPTGSFNKGALLSGGRLYGSDFRGIVRM